jgi:outer membrane receptor for ferrienterochelin and colicins
MKSMLDLKINVAEIAPPYLTTRRVRAVRLSSSLAGVLFGAILPCLAWTGPQQGSPDLAEQSLTDLMNIKVYGAARYIQPASDAPVSVTVVTRDEIDKAGYRTLADILRSVRGFYISNDRLYSYVGVRGFSNPGDYNTRVLLMVDGHRLNDAIYEQAMVGTEFALDVDLIARVEIIRGPASSLYGTNAVFAVINVITRKADEIHGIEFEGDGGSFNSYRGRIAYGGRVAGVDAVLSGTFYGSKGHNQLFYPQFNSAETNNGIASHGDDDQSVNLLTTLSTHGLRFQAAYDTREKGDPTGSYGDVFNDPRNRESDAHGYLDLRYEHALGRGSSFSARTYFDRYMNDGKFVTPVANGRVLNKDFARGESWGTELQMTNQIRQRYKLVTGFEYRNDFRQQLVNFDVSPPAIYLDVDKPSFVSAPYFEADIPLGKGFSFDPSIREDYNPRVGWILSPRGALNYHALENTHLRLTYGESFRSPNAYELYYYSGYFNSYSGAPHLNAERIRAWEGNWDQVVSHNIGFSLSIFSNHMRDFIALGSNNITGSAFQNIGAMSVSGGEAEVRGQWSNGVSGTASFSQAFAQSGPGSQPLVNSPKELGKLNVSVPLIEQKLFATVDAQYVSRRATLTPQDVSPYAVANITLLGRELARNLDLSASVYNVFDKRFYDPGAQQHVQDAIQQDGRAFRAKLVWTFGAK